MKIEYQFVICLYNADYRASLELRKLYQVLPDEDAAQHGYIRVVDESGEDYLFPRDWFMLVELPETLKKSLLAA